MLELIGWTLIAAPLVLGVYAFGVYPLLVWLWSRLRAPFELAPEPAEWPMLTILIVAYNEERRLRRTIDTALAVDYPADRLDVLVVSDASSDGTDALVRDYGDPRVRLLRQPERRGKPAGENASGAHVKGEYVVSIDASILIPRDSLKPLVRALLVPGVGLASGRDISVGDEAREGNKAESSYVGLEMTLRAFETRVHSIVGASGCFYAARRDLHALPLPEHLSRDFAAASVARSHGYRAVSVDDATCLVPRTPTLKAELRRKSRTMGRGLGTLVFLRAMLNPFRYGSYAFMMAGAQAGPLAAVSGDPGVVHRAAAAAAERAVHAGAHGRHGGRPAARATHAVLAGWPPPAEARVVSRLRVREHRGGLDGLAAPAARARSWPPGSPPSGPP